MGMTSAAAVRNLARYSLDDEAGFQAFLQREPCVVVLFRGRQCPYSARLEGPFEEAARGDEGWSFAIRQCRSGDAGDVNQRYGIRVTPTLVAFQDGKEVARLEAKMLVGITKQRMQDWIDGLEPTSCC